MVFGMRRGMLGRRGWTVASVAALAVCVGVLVNGPLWGGVDAVDGCHLGPTIPELRSTGHTGYTWPYGAVTGCREFGHRDHWNSGDSTEWLVVDTDRGAVLIRLEVVDHDRRFWRAIGHETEPDDAPGGLTDDEVRRLRTDVAARGGVRTEPWIFEYGDG
ncbi:hypothetical protein AB0B31_33500 [Catellatospora citrea]|uniref:hypothetical protein n=1 Tax=Catellatospora citrea TaxID=53366 RepID=UPI0033E8B613